MAAVSIIISPPVGKSGAGSVDMMLCSGSRMSSIAVSQTSARLKPHIWLAMPTAMPVFAETRTLGNAVGSSTGSFMLPS